MLITVMTANCPMDVNTIRFDANMNILLRFLIVDDHAPSRVVLNEMIATQPGWQVVGQATNGLEAISSVRSQQPDIVLMDVAMPQMNGIQTTRKIKATFPQTKVILFSAYVDRGYQRGSEEAGADYFIHKEELNIQSLREIVEHVLEK